MPARVINPKGLKKGGLNYKKLLEFHTLLISVQTLPYWLIRFRKGIGSGSLIKGYLKRRVMDDDLFLSHQVGNVPLNGDEEAAVEDKVDS